MWKYKLESVKLYLNDGLKCLTLVINSSVQMQWPYSLTHSLTTEKANMYKCIRI